MMVERRPVLDFFAHAVLLLGVLVIAFPVYLALVASTQTAEQIAWVHTFSDGITRDSGDVLIELMEFAIQWRKANGLPTTAK